MSGIHFTPEHEAAIKKIESWPGPRRVYGPPVIRKVPNKKWQLMMEVLTPAGYMTLRRTASTRREAKSMVGEILERIASDRFGYYLPRPGNINLYFVQAVKGGPIKIGLANNVNRRLKTLQHACPVELKVLYVIPGVSKEAELLLHTRFRDDRLHGEWFKPRAVNRYIVRHRETKEWL